MKLAMLLVLMALVGCGESDGPASGKPDAGDAGGTGGDGSVDDGGGDDGGAGEGGADDTASSGDDTGGGGDDTGSGIETGVAVGLLAPDFELLDQGGQAFRLSDQRGSRVLVFGIRAWCPYCQETAEKMQEYHVGQAESDQLVVGVLVEDNSGAPADVADAAEYAERVGLTYTVLADPERAWATTYASPDGADAHRTYVVVDSTGVISWMQQDGSRARRRDMVAAMDAAD